MTREEAKKMMWKENDDGLWSRHHGYDIIDKIFDDFERRSCMNCKYYTKERDNFNYCDNNSILNGCISDEFCCNEWEKK